MALCEVNPPVNGGFPPQRASNASWCHHETPVRMSCQAQHRSRITTESQISTHAMLVTKGVCRRLLTTGVYASSRLNSFAAGGVYMHRRIGPSLIWDSRLPCHLLEIKIIIFNQKRKLQYNVNPRQPSNIIWILCYIICIANMQKLISQQIENHGPLPRWKTSLLTHHLRCNFGASHYLVHQRERPHHLWTVETAENDTP